MTGNQTVSSMFDFSSFIRMVKICTFWAVWIEDLGPIVASSFFAIARVTQYLVTLYDILLRHRSTLYFCGYDWLSSMDPPCSFVATTPLDLIWCLFAYWVTMIVSSVIHMLDLPESLWRCFVYGLICPRDQFFWHLSLFQVPLFKPFDLGFSALSILRCFLYNVFRLSSSPITSHIRGHLL